MKNRRIVQLTLIIFITGCFIAGAHLLYNNVIQVWNENQLEDLAARSITRTERATDLAVSTIARIQSKDLATCSPRTIAAFRSYVMSVGSIKDIRMRANGKTCAVFTSDGLQADLEATNIWQQGRNPAIRLGVLKQGKSEALSVLWTEKDHDLVAVVSTGGLLYDMVPSSLRPHLKMRISLTNGIQIAAYAPEEQTPHQHTRKGAELISFTARSTRYPVTAELTLARADLQSWNNDHSLLFDLMGGLVGLVVGFLAARALFPPKGPVDELDEAIRNGEFTPYFQPIINLSSCEISGFEMLARWIRPNGEMISPGRFIPLAENFGRIDDMLFSLLRSAGTMIGPELHDNPQLKMTFNITPEQFLDPTFLPRLLDVLESVDLPLHNLVAEITERQQLADLELASLMVAQYRKHGIRIALDDVGTGHNGLTSIQKLDIETLKLDKIFIDGIVDNERSRQMVELLANLARQYKMNVVAEGIEHPDQAIAAHSMGIREGQGFYFSRPIPALELLGLLAEQRRPLVQNNTPHEQDLHARQCA